VKFDLGVRIALHCLRCRRAGSNKRLMICCLSFTCSVEIESGVKVRFVSEEQ
jgi:hypothetical protein